MYPQPGHSYAINLSSPASGSMRTTPSTAAPHREHARDLLLDRSDPVPTPYVRALLSCVSPPLPTRDVPVGWEPTKMHRPRMPTAGTHQAPQRSLD
jgi:hypothetical protein